MTQFTRAFVFVTVVALSLTASSRAADVADSPASAPTTSATAADIGRLIEQLASEDYQDRTAARRKLVQIGAPAAEKLKNIAQTTTDPELGTQIETLLVEIKEHADRAARRVSLHVTDAHPKEVFDELCRQIDFEVPADEHLWDPRYGGDHAPITIDIESQPMLVALREFCRTSRLGLQPDHMNDSAPYVLSRHWSGEMAGPYVAHDRFLVSVQCISGSVQFDADSGQPQRSTSVSFVVYAEPHVNLSGSSSMLVLDEATDDRGNSLIQPERKQQMQQQAERGRYHDNHQRYIYRVQDIIASPPYGATRLTRVAGRFLLRHAARIETFEVTDVLKANEGGGDDDQTNTQVVAGLRIKLHGVSSNGDNCEAKLTIEPAGIDPTLWQNFFQMNLTSDIVMYDADGNALRNSGGGNTHGSEERYECEIHFHAGRWGDKPAPGAPHRLVWNLPAEMTESAVPFEFTDLPLP